MTKPEVRNQVVEDIELAVKEGARWRTACAMMGVATTTLRRWKPSGSDAVLIDQRPTAIRPAPSNQLSELERQRIVSVCNESDFSSLPPSQIVPRLADQGVYIASESSFYRVLKAEGQLQHRGRAKRKPSRKFQQPISPKLTQRSVDVGYYLLADHERSVSTITFT